MLTTPMSILEAYPIRKSKKQKQAFREDVQALVEGWGYESKVEKGSFGAKNLIIGDPTKAKYLITAHYDTCARLPMPNLITPKNFWLFMGYQFLLAGVMLAMPLIVAVPVYYFTKNFELSFNLWYVGILAVLILMSCGPANKTNANDNTSGVITALEIAKSLPQSQRSKVCFVLFDLEEAGLLGSMGYAKKHKKEIQNQIVLNLDCVGDGDHLYFFPSKKLRKDPSKMAFLQKAAGTFGEKSLTVHQKGFSVYPSDQANFPFGVGICALHKGKLALYMNRIHTSKDTLLEQTNVNLLRAALISMITGDAA